MDSGNTVFGKPNQAASRQGQAQPGQRTSGPTGERPRRANAPHATEADNSHNTERQPAPRQDRDSAYFLNRIEEKLKTAKKFPLSEQCLVDRVELLILLDNVKKTLPDDLRRAQWLLEQNQNLIAETRKEAEKIMREAEQETAKMIDEHEITQAAQLEAQRILEEAAMQSQQIHDETAAYVAKMLQDLEDQLTEMLVYIRKNKSQI